jgi:S1-C subfamily serine protease
MKQIFWFLTMGLGLAIGSVWAAQEAGQADTGQADADIINKAEQSMVLILVGNGGGRVLSVNTGVIICPDGIVLTAYRPLRGAQEVQVRLRDGEVYD